MRVLLLAMALASAGMAQQSAIYTGASFNYHINSTFTPQAIDYRVDARLHNWTLPGSGMSVFELQWIGVKVLIYSSGQLYCVSTRDGGTLLEVGTNFLSGKNDVVIRVQRVAAENRLYCEARTTDLASYASASLAITGSAVWSNVNYTRAVLGGLMATTTIPDGQYTGRMDYLRVSSATLPLQSRLSWQDTALGTIASWEFEGDATARLTDSTGGKTLTAVNTPTYAASLTGTPVASPRGDNTTIFSQAPLKAGQSNTLGNWSICRNNSPCSSYFWTQTGGPSTLSWSSRTSATPTVTGAVATTGTDYTIRLVTTDSSGAIGTTDLALGAVAVDANDVVIIPNTDVKNLLGSSGFIRYGSNPWVYEDYAEDQRLKQIAGWMGLDPTIATDYRLTNYWDTAQTGTVYVNTTTTAVNGSGTSFQTVFSCAPGTANTANVAAGTELTWVSGPTYTAGLVGTAIRIDGLDPPTYVVSVTDSTHLIAYGSYGTRTAATTQIRDVITLWYPRTDATIGRRDIQISTCSSNTSLTLMSAWDRPTISVGNAVQFSRAASGSSGAWGDNGNDFYDNKIALYRMAYRTGLKYYWDAAKEFFYRTYTNPFWDQMESVLINDGRNPRNYGTAGLFVGYFVNPEMVPGTFLTRMGYLMDRIVQRTSYAGVFNDAREMSYEVSGLQMGAKWANPSGSRAAWQTHVDGLIGTKFPLTVMADGSYPNDSTYSSDILFNVTNGSANVTRQSGATIPATFCDTAAFSAGTVAWDGTNWIGTGTSWSAAGGYQIEVYGTGLTGVNATYKSYVSNVNSTTSITPGHAYTGTNTTGLSYKLYAQVNYNPVVFGTGQAAADAESHSCVRIDGDNITLDRPYNGTTGTGGSAKGYWQFFLPAKSSLPFHNGGIVATAMDHVRLFSSNSTTANQAATYQQNLANYMLNYAYWPLTKGVYYGLNSPGCLPDPTRQTGCTGLARSDANPATWSVGANRDFALNTFGGMSHAYVLSPSAPKLAMLDDLYTGAYAKLGYPAPTQGDGSLSTIYDINGGSFYYPTRNGKTSGEAFGYAGCAPCWPAARLGGITAADPVTVEFALGPAAGESAAPQVIYTSPTSAATTVTCSAASTGWRCPGAGNRRDGQDLLHQVVRTFAPGQARGEISPVRVR